MLDRVFLIPLEADVDPVRFEILADGAWRLEIGSPAWISERGVRLSHRPGQRHRHVERTRVADAILKHPLLFLITAETSEGIQTVANNNYQKRVSSGSTSPKPSCGSQP